MTFKPGLGSLKDIGNVSIRYSACDFLVPIDVHLWLSSVVSEIFNVEKCRDLEIRIPGHSRPLKVVRCTVFEIFDFKNAVTLKTGLVVRQGIGNVIIR